MATRKIVPRADNEGGLGTALKRWASAFIAAITCTTINALTLAAASVGFTIAGGTTSKTLTVTADTSLDEAVAMSSKLPIPGAWITPAFDAVNFYAESPMTWTVEEADVFTYAYQIVGKMMTLLFFIENTTLGGTATGGLMIRIPASKVATKYAFAVCQIKDNATWTLGVCYTLPTSGAITFNIYAIGTDFSLSTNATRVAGQITFEID